MWLGVVVSGLRVQGNSSIQIFGTAQDVSNPVADNHAWYQHEVTSDKKTEASYHAVAKLPSLGNILGLSR